MKIVPYGINMLLYPPKFQVAAVAQEAANLTRVVVMIDAELTISLAA